MSILHRVCSLTSWEQPPSTQPAVGSRLWAGPLGQSTPLCLKAGLGFSLAPLPRTASQLVNHTTRPHCAAWPTGTLAMATQIPADLAVMNRSSQKYERQESLIQCTHLGFVPRTKMSWSYERCILQFNSVDFMWNAVIMLEPSLNPKKQSHTIKWRFHNQIAPRKMCLSWIHNFAGTEEARRNTEESTVWAVFRIKVANKTVICSG